MDLGCVDDCVAREAALQSEVPELVFGAGFLSSFVSVPLGGAIIATISAAGCSQLTAGDASARTRDKGVALRPRNDLICTPAPHQASRPRSRGLAARKRRPHG